MTRNLGAPRMSTLASSESGQVRRRAQALLASAAIVLAVLVTSAAPVAAASHAKPGGGSTSSTGNDISWPQCGGSFPSGQAFGIVGVNGGLANNQNPCLTSELAWAWGSSGSLKLPRASLYVNTANPGPGVGDWPTSGTDPQGNTCDGSDSPACAWQYGWDRATQDIAWLEAAAAGVNVANSAGDYRWWLDVETANSWETGTAADLANNVADIQGMGAAFAGAVDTITGTHGSVGIYSTSYQWGVITGGSAAGNLNGLPDWIPGARRLSSAKSNCTLSSFTKGSVMITQWFGQQYDGDWAC